LAGTYRSVAKTALAAKALIVLFWTAGYLYQLLPDVSKTALLNVE